MIAIGDTVTLHGRHATVLAFRNCENSCCHEREAWLRRESDSHLFWYCEQFLNPAPEFALTKGVDGQPVITRNGFDVVANGRGEIERVFALAMLALRVTK